MNLLYDYYDALKLISEMKIAYLTHMDQTTTNDKTRKLLINIKYTISQCVMLMEGENV